MGKYIHTYIYTNYYMGQLVVGVLCPRNILGHIRMGNRSVTMCTHGN